MNLFRAFATVGGLTLASRALGLVREIMIAALLGAGPIAEAFFVAFRLPNLFRRFFAEGAFNMAFVPLFAKKIEGDGRAAARIFGEDVLASLLTLLLGLTLVAQLMMPWLIYALAAGFADDPDKFALATQFATIQFPYLVFMSLVALFAGVLNSLGKFAAAAAAPILLNLAMIVGMALAWRFEANIGLWLSWSVFIAGVLQFWFVAGAARRAGLTLSLRFPRWTPDLGRLVALGGPGLLAGGVTQINILIGTVIASFFDGAVAWLTFADRIYQLPLGVVGIALGVALLPDLSRRVRAEDRDGALRTLRQATAISLAFSVPAAAALMVVPGEIVGVIYQRGAFSAADAEATALALAIFAAGLPAYVLIKAINAPYFASEDTRTPLIYAAISTGVGTAISIGLTAVISWLAIPLGTAVAAWLNVVLLERGLRERDAASIDGFVLGRTLRIGAATLVMVGALLAAVRLAPELYSDPLWRYPSVLGLVLLGMLVYGLAGWAFGAVKRADLGALRRGEGPAGPNPAADI